MKNIKSKLLLIILIWIIAFWSVINITFASGERMPEEIGEPNPFCFKFNNWTIYDYYEKQSDNKNVDCPKEFIIPSKINWISVVEIWDKAFSGKKITSIVIPDSITEIWSHAFSGNQLTSIIIPNSVKKIWKNSFDKKVEIIKWEIEKPFNFLDFLKGLFNKFLGLFK